MKRLLAFFYYPGCPTLRELRQPHGARELVRIHHTVSSKAYFNCFGVLFNPKAVWVGGHYSSENKRLCLNLVPCLTLWWTRPGGKLP